MKKLSLVFLEMKKKLRMKKQQVLLIHNNG